MFAFFGSIGCQELIILAVLGFMFLGGAVAIILVVTLLSRRGEKDDPSAK